MILVKPFKVAQEGLEGEKYISVSLIPSTIKMLRNQLDALSNDETSTLSHDVKGLAKKMCLLILIPGGGLVVFIFKIMLAVLWNGGCSRPYEEHNTN
jgi:hypothetical protein